MCAAPCFTLTETLDFNQCIISCPGYCTSHAHSEACSVHIVNPVQHLARFALFMEKKKTLYFNFTTFMSHRRNRRYISAFNHLLFLLVTVLMLKLFFGFLNTEQESRFINMHNHLPSIILSRDISSVWSTVYKEARLVPASRRA